MVECQTERTDADEKNAHSANFSLIFLTDPERCHCANMCQIVTCVKTTIWSTLVP